MLFLAQQWIRNLFPNAQWNSQDRTIGLPGGVTLREGQGFTIGADNKAMVNGPNSLISPYLSAPNAQVDPARFGKYYGMGEQWYGDLHDAKLNSLRTETGNKRTQLGLNYNDAMANTKEDEGKSLMGVSASIANRGMGSSGVANYQRKQMQGEYAKKYDFIGKNRDELMLSLANSEMAGQRELDAGLRHDAMMYAQRLMDRDLDAEQKTRNDIVNNLRELAKSESDAEQQQWQRGITEAGLTGNYNGQYTMNGRNTLAGLTGVDPATGQATYDAQKADRDYELRRSLNNAQINKYNLETSGKDTVKERQNAATADLLNKAVGRYKENMQKGLKYPGYYTVSSLLSDPEWMVAAKKSGANSKDAIDMLLTSLGTTPAEFFTGETAKLLPLYNQLGGGDSAIMGKALAAAQKDPSFGNDPDSDRELINYYRDILSGGGGSMASTGTPTTGATDEDIMQYLR